MSFVEQSKEQLPHSLDSLPVGLDIQRRTHDLSHLLTPDLFQDRIGTSVKHLLFKVLEQALAFFFMISYMLFAVRATTLITNSKICPNASARSENISLKLSHVMAF